MLPSTNLFDRFIAPANFQQAYDRIAHKKAAGGVDGMTVAEFTKNLERRLERLRREILEGSYLPEATLEVKVPKFNAAGEMRELGLPTVADKVVQAALLQVIEPLAEKQFLPASYGYRLGKGHYKAIRQVEHNLANRRLTSVMHRDIDNFFDSLDHDRLLDRFATLVQGDRRLMSLVALWCKTGIVARDGRWRNVETGVRQGQILSPLLANLYLHELDQFATGLDVAWVRYADDYLIQARERSLLIEADRQITTYLTAHLKLHLNEGGGPTNLDSGFTFLGVFFKGSERSIAEGKIVKMKRKISYLLNPLTHAAPADLIHKLDTMIASWRRYYSFLQPTDQFKIVEDHINSELQRLIQEKTAKGQWQEEPPEELALPGFDPGRSTADRKRQLYRLWRDSSRRETDSITAKVGKQTAKRRRQHQRRVNQEGELFVVTPGSFVGKRGGRIFVRQKQEIQAEVLATGLRSLTLAGHFTALSSDVVNFCSEKDIPIHFLDEKGRTVAILQAPDSSRSEVARLQALHQDDTLGLKLARMFVLGKIKNQLATLKYFDKYRNRANGRFGSTLAEMRPGMETIISSISHGRDIGAAGKVRQELMGLEGRFAADYWRMVGILLPEEARFLGRHHEGATDLVNGLLNYGYGVLYAKVLTAAVQAGLNPNIGFLHAENRGKPVLSYDLIEEFRAPVVDRTVFAMLNRRERLEHDQGLLSEGTRRKVAAEVLTRLSVELRWHRKAGTLLDIIKTQAKGVVDHLRGSLTYRPFLVAW